MLIEHKENFILIIYINDENQFIEEKFIGYSEKEATRIFKEGCEREVNNNEWCIQKWIFKSAR